MLVSLNTQPNYIKKYTSPSFQRIQPKKRLSRDVFIRSVNSDFLSLPPQIIFQRIKNSLKNKMNFLGRGGEAEVWKIKDSEYCVRIPHDSFGKIYNEYSRRVNIQDKFNHVKAKLGNGASIMTFLKGYTYYTKDKNNQEISKMVESMPISAFERLIMQIFEAENIADLSFDPGYKNIIINPDDSSLTAIDFYNRKNNKDNLLNKIYRSIMPKYSTTTEQRRIVAGKVILASLLIQQKNIGMNPFLNGFNKLIDSLKEEEIINKNYAEVLSHNINMLDNNTDSSGNTKVIIALLKQLFGVAYK